MITITTQASGNDVAKALADDPEEAGMMLTELADLLTDGDRGDLLGWVEDYSASMGDRERLRLLGELLIAASA